jgi:histidine triad (HIT) family protein
MTDCIFCRIAAGEIPARKVFEDEHFVAFHDLHPKAAVHLLVIPRKHITSLAELPPGDEGLMGQMMRLLPQLARDQGLDGFRTIINTGRSGGQEIFHLHIHLLGGEGLPGF